MVKDTPPSVAPVKWASAGLAGANSSADAITAAMDIAFTTLVRMTY
jgi:hypothetical protein